VTTGPKKAGRSITITIRIGASAPTPLRELVSTLEQQRGVKVDFAPTCAPSVASTVIAAGIHEGDSPEEFLERLQYQSTPAIRYRVTPSGPHHEHLAIDCDDVEPSIVTIQTPLSVSLAEMVKLLERELNVTIVISPTCRPDIARSVLDPGTYSASSAHDFLDRLQYRTKPQVKYTVKTSGDKSDRYELVCN
jgi:hypothetical protein